MPVYRPIYQHPRPQPKTALLETADGGATVALDARTVGISSVRGAVSTALAFASRLSGSARTLASPVVARALTANAFGVTTSRAGTDVARDLTARASSGARTLANVVVARALAVRSSAVSMVQAALEGSGAIAARVMASARVVGSLVMARSLDAVVGARTATRASQNVQLALSAISNSSAAIRASASIALALAARAASGASARAEQTAGRALSAVIRTGASVRANLPPLFEEVVGFVNAILRASMRIAKIVASVSDAPIVASARTEPIIVSAVMIPKNVTLKGYVIGDDTEIPFQLTDWPAGVLLAKAYFTVKKSLKDADVAAIIQRDITATLTAEGQITANGASGTAEGYFLIRHQDNEWANVKPGIDYQFDIQPITDQATLRTPIVGTISFRKGATDAIS